MKYLPRYFEHYELGKFYGVHKYVKVTDNKKEKTLSLECQFSYCTISKELQKVDPRVFPFIFNTQK